MDIELSVFPFYDAMNSFGQASVDRRIARLEDELRALRRA
jgi:hypothetical protein